MKTRKYIYTTLATCLFVFSSCLNDLDVLPLDPTVETADKAYTCLLYTSPSPRD